jgi:hypothetical protein
MRSKTKLRTKLILTKVDHLKALIDEIFTRVLPKLLMRNNTE